MCRANSFIWVEGFRSTNPYFPKIPSMNDHTVLFPIIISHFCFSFPPFFFRQSQRFLLKFSQVIHLKRLALCTIWTFHSEYCFLGRMKNYSLISGVQNSLWYFHEDLLHVWYCANISLFVHKDRMNKHLHLCAAIANTHLTTELMVFSLKNYHFECCQASLHLVHQAGELLT